MVVIILSPSEEDVGQSKRGGDLGGEAGEIGEAGPAEGVDAES